MAARWPPRPARQPAAASRSRPPQAAGRPGRPDFTETYPTTGQNRAASRARHMAGEPYPEPVMAARWSPWPGRQLQRPAEAGHGRLPAGHGGQGGDRGGPVEQPMGTLEKLMVSQQFARGLSQPNPLPLLYPRGIPPSQEFLQFSVWFSTTFWRTSENPCDMQFCQVFAQKRWFRPGRRTGVVFSTDGPNLALFMWGPHGGVPRGPRGIPEGPGPAARPWPVIRRFYARFSPFSPFFARFASFS